MYPFFEPMNWFMMYSFWLTITICFFLFLWMLKKLSTKFNFDYSMFTKNMLWYFLSMFIFSSLFYIMWKWNELKYMQNSLEFFMMNDYNFSLFWAIIWFFMVLFMNMKLSHELLMKYIDWVMMSFIFMLFMWYIWAFLWWQVYWSETTFWMEILYNHPFTPVPYQIPIFPLAMMYSISFFMLFSVLYILSMYVKIKWLLWYMWLMVFSSIMLSLEFFSGKNDMLKEFININFSQLFAVFCMIFAVPKLYKIYKSEN